MGLRSREVQHVLRLDGVAPRSHRDSLNCGALPIDVLQRVLERVTGLARYREAIIHVSVSLLFPVQGHCAKGELRLFTTAGKVIQFAGGNRRVLSYLSHEHVTTQPLRPRAY